MMQHSRRAGIFALLLALALVAAACSSDKKSDSGGKTTTTSSAKAGGKLVGLFKITAAACTSGKPTGSYFRMVQSTGTLAAGPFITNADSTCTDKTYSALVPGTDAGLTAGKYQPQPDPPFDAAKNGLANKITEPTKFFAVGFAMSTNEKDPQTSADVPAPSITADASGVLTGDMSAVSVAWNGLQFNQGSPKPDGSHPGSTKDLSGTYDATTGAFTMEWSSQIVGGAFDGFTGVWHLAGTFEKS